MKTKEKFPLAIWQNGEEYRAEFSKQQERLRLIYSRLRQRGFECLLLDDLRFDADGFPEAFLTDSMPPGVKFGRHDQKTAREFALRYGSRRWWRLDELEEFASGTGIIMDEAMWELGFRKSRKKTDSWARKTKCDLSALDPYGQERWGRRMDRSFTNINLAAGEEARLKTLIAGLSDEAVPNETFNFSAGRNGMIFAELDVNPFGSIEELAVALKRRCHIARQQAGFAIQAENVIIDNDPTVHIKAIRPDGTVVETVWPARVRQEKVQGMAEDLVRRVNQAN